MSRFLKGFPDKVSRPGERGLLGGTWGGLSLEAGREERPADHTMTQVGVRETQWQRPLFGPSGLAYTVASSLSLVGTLISGWITDRISFARRLL